MIYITYIYIVCFCFTILLLFISFMSLFWIYYLFDNLNLSFYRPNLVAGVTIDSHSWWKYWGHWGQNQAHKGWFILFNRTPSFLIPSPTYCKCLTNTTPILSPQNNIWKKLRQGCVELKNRCLNLRFKPQSCVGRRGRPPRATGRGAKT